MEGVEECRARQSERHASLTAGEPPLQKETEGQSEEQFRLVTFAMVGYRLRDFQDHGAI